MPVFHCSDTLKDFLANETFNEIKKLRVTPIKVDQTDQRLPAAASLSDQ